MYNMSLISVNIIRKAKQPDAKGKALLDLCDAMEREEYAPMSALDAILPHLRERRLPTDAVRDATFVAAVDRGVCALVALEAWVRWGSCDDDPSATPTLLDAYQAILSWFRFLFLSRPAVGPALPQRMPWRTLPDIFVELVGCLTSWDEETANSVSSSQSTVITLLEIWNYSSCDASSAFEAASLYTMLDTLNKCLTLASGKVSFLDVTMQSRDGVSNFCTGLEQRITQFKSLNKDLERVEAVTPMCLRLLLKVTFDATGVSTQIRSTMHSLGYIRKIGALGVDVHPMLRTAAAFAVWEDIMDLAFQHGPAGVSRLLDSGFLPLFVKDMTKAKHGIRTNDNLQQTSRILHKLVAMSCLASQYTIPSSQQPFAGQNAFSNNWNKFVKNISHSFGDLKALEEQGQGKLSTRLCDSETHQELQSLLSEMTGSCPFVPKTESKCCAGCHMIVYCSTMCQYADWKGRHQKECAAMSRLRHDLKRSGAFYSNNSRYFNIEAARMSVAQKMPYFDNSIHHHFPGKDKQQAIVTFDVLDGPVALEGGFILLEEMDNHFVGQKKGDCAVLEKRYEALIKRYTSCDAPPRTWLVDLTIPWGRDSILSQLIELLPTGRLDEDNRSVCFVVGHAWRTEPLGEKAESQIQ
ncbi:hypothetical protein BKA70DRAFT_1223454 [Coprinopsis sp. MPI-PUGE-AT-0042]|nr:hypothetical protein BKA70DRAFT_1223454 [Coprinopsis sp. MPI-PUGE-AT-0042]